MPDGQLITTDAPYRLHADGSSHALALPASLDATLPLTAALAQADGKILLAQNSTLVRLSPDDSVDATFTYAPTLGLPHVITRLQLDDAGRIYVAATAHDPDPWHFPTFYPVTFRLTTSGVADAAFGSYDLAMGKDSAVALYPLSDHHVLLATIYEESATWTLLNDDGTVVPGWSGRTGFAPGYGSPYVVDPVHLRVFSAQYPLLRRQLIAPTGLVDDPTFYPGSGYYSSVQLSPAGDLYLGGSFAAWDGHASSGLVRLRDGDVTVPIPPKVVAGASSTTPANGSAVALNAGVSGPDSYTYQWVALDGQSLPAAVSSAELDFPNFSASNFGRYQVRVSGPAGTVLSRVIDLDPGNATADLPYLANLSGRAFVGTGDATTIAGLTVQTNTSFAALLRGAGPALQAYGVNSFLPNPVLNLYSSIQLIGNNDNWGGTSDLRDAATLAGAFPFAANSNDAAMLRTFTSGNYSLQLVDASGASGVGIVEIYRRNVGGAYSGDLVNLSLRARTGPGENVATAGFVIVDPLGYNRSVRLLLRAIGPTLTHYGVGDVLPDPVLTLYQSSGERLATNDNWSESANAAAVASAATQVGAFALSSGSKDASLLIDLPPGVYSMQSSGAPGTPATGATLIEIYLLR